MGELIYYDGYFVFKENKLFFIQKDVGSYPSQTGYTYSEIGRGSPHERAESFFYSNLRQAQGEKIQIPEDKISEVLKIMFKCRSIEEKRAGDQKINNVIGWVSKHNGNQDIINKVVQSLK